MGSADLFTNHERFILSTISSVLFPTILIEAWLDGACLLAVYSPDTDLVFVAAYQIHFPVAHRRGGAGVLDFHAYTGWWSAGAVYRAKGLFTQFWYYGYCHHHQTGVVLIDADFVLCQHAHCVLCGVADSTYYRIHHGHFVLTVHSPPVINQLLLRGEVLSNTTDCTRLWSRPLFCAIHSLIKWHCPSLHWCSRWHHQPLLSWYVCRLLSSLSALASTSRESTTSAS